MKLSYKLCFLIGIMSLFISSCIDEDYEDCPTALMVSFYSKTPCRTDTVYPEQIKNITLCIFNSQDILVSHQELKDVNLHKGFSEKVEVPEGLYTALAWSGLNNTYYDITNLQNGATSKSELLFRLKRTQENAIAIDGTNLYQGESRAVYIESGNSQPSSKHVSVNLLEVTNRITVTVEGLEGDMADYEIAIEADNGSMNIDGTIAQDEVLQYPSQYINSEILEAKFTLLKLETGHHNMLIIRHKETGVELYKGNLLGTLLLKNPEVNLNCDHDFTINFTAKDQCNCGTYVIAEIFVNDWLVHSYETDI